MEQLDFTVALSKKIKELRVKKGLSYSEAARVLGLKSGGNVEYYERPSCNPSVYTFCRLCFAYEVDPVTALLEVLEECKSSY